MSETRLLARHVGAMLGLLLSRATALGAVCGFPLELMVAGVRAGYTWRRGADATERES